MEAKSSFVVCYDITDPKRWRKAYRLLHGYGRPLQYSIFRCRLTIRQMEEMKWKLEKELTAEDRLLIICLCEGCEQRTIARNRPESWTEPHQRFDIA